MGRIVYFESRKPKKPTPARSRPPLPRLLAQLIEAGMPAVAADVLHAWGRGELNEAEAAEYCATLVAVAGVKDSEDPS